MKIQITALPGVYEFTPQVYDDTRGSFTETYRADVLREVVGHPVTWVQGNTSVSRLHALRGIHYSLAPEGQAKYVTCLRGMVHDVIVDLRVGSPTFGAHASVILAENVFNAVYIPPGFGHGFLALEENSLVNYQVSSHYSPDHEYGITPFDPTLDIGWCNVLDPVLSPKDTAARSLREAQEAGVLPVYTPESRDTDN